MKTRLLALALLVAAGAAGACGRTTGSTDSTAIPSFDAWSDAFAQDWLRDAPQFATRTQYFSGAEQDALDRQLALMGDYGNAFGSASWSKRAVLARRGRDELQR